MGMSSHNKLFVSGNTALGLLALALYDVSV